jgi:hypothetical protein
MEQCRIRSGPRSRFIAALAVTVQGIVVQAVLETMAWRKSFAGENHTRDRWLGPSPRSTSPHPILGGSQVTLT